MIIETQPAQATPAEGLAMEGQDVMSQHTWDRQVPLQPWQSSLQHAGTQEHASPNVSRDSRIVRGRPVLQSRVVWAPLPVQPAGACAVLSSAAPYIVIGREHEQSLPPPQAGTPAQQAAPDTVPEWSLSGGSPWPAQRSHAAFEPSQLTTSDADMRPCASLTQEQQDMSSGVESGVPIMGAEGSPAQGTPNLDVLSSIDMLMQQQALQPPGAAALSASDPGQSASFPGPPSMLSAAGMEPPTPQM